jgi:hypothetical protein
MDMHARNEYMNTLRTRYCQTRHRQEKSRILDEYCANTGQNRKYAIRKIRPNGLQGKKARKKRKPLYDGAVIASLAQVWQIFDHPCGQRLKPLLVCEVDRLRAFGELPISAAIADQLKRMAPATIDRKLRHQREVLHLQRGRGLPRPGGLLFHQIPIRRDRWDPAQFGYLEVDLVEHCGSSAAGDYLNTLSTVEIASGWWEGEAVCGKGQERVFNAIRAIRARAPFPWRGIDSDNGGEFVNHLLYHYCRKEGLSFTRSRPYHKNDNAHVEGKNWTHVRKALGYLRYDSEEERVLIEALFRGPYRLYMNFFQPVMKLVAKERVGGKVKRRYDLPQTPFQRLLASPLSEREKERLRATYLQLNPAQLKRSIDVLIDRLYQAYQEKTNRPSLPIQSSKRQVPRSVTSLMMQRPTVRLPG